MNMNTFSKTLVALIVVSMVVASGSAFAGQKKHKKHKNSKAQVEQKNTSEAKPAKAEKLPE